MDKPPKSPTRKQRINAALNIAIALSQIPKAKKPLSERELRFRNALGVRLKVEEPRSKN